MYFKNFPKIFYDFNVTDNDRKLKALTDITANVRVRKAIIEKVTLYDEYDVQDGETPELISEKFYGTPDFHWILMILNERYDYVNDFPYTQEELEQHVKDLYGENKINDIHHYEKNGIVVEAKAILKVPASTLLPTNQFKVNDYVLTDTTIARVDSINVANLELSISIQRGQFKAGDAVDVWGFREDVAQQRIEYSRAFVFTVPQNAFTLNETYNAITNYDHEIKLNEKKRKIKILAPELLAQVNQELADIINV